MREVDRRTKVSRRVFLRGSATAVPAAAAAVAGMSISPDSSMGAGRQEPDAAHDGDTGADGARHLSA